MAPRVRIVFVDAVNTLVCVRGSVGAVYARVAAQHGLDASPAHIDLAFGRAMALAPPALFPGTPPQDIPERERDWWRNVVARTMAPLDREPGFDAFFGDVFALFATASAWELLPGAHEALTQARRDGYRLGIVSEMDGRLHSVLTDLGIASWFDTVALAPRLHAGKRGGRLFEAALAIAGVAGDAAVHVGDSVEADVMGAGSAGITPILFDPQGHASNLQAVATIAAWAQLRAALEAIETGGGGGAGRGGGAGGAA